MARPVTKLQYKLHLPKSDHPLVPLCDRKNAYGTLPMAHTISEATCLSCLRANEKLKDVVKYKQLFGEPRNRDHLYRRLKIAKGKGLI